MFSEKHAQPELTKFKSDEAPEIRSTAGFLSDLLAMAISQRAQSPRTQARIQSSSWVRQFLFFLPAGGFLELRVVEGIPVPICTGAEVLWPASKCSLWVCVNQICLEDGQVAWNSDLNHMPSREPWNEGSNGANNLLFGLGAFFCSWAERWFFFPWEEVSEDENIYLETT